MTLKGVKNIVHSILIESEKARGNDDWLYLVVLGTLGIDTNESLCHFLVSRQARCIPSFEAVRRARQKVQAENKELRPADNVINGRNISQADYYGFAKE